MKCVASARRMIRGGARARTCSPALPFLPLLTLTLVALGMGPAHAYWSSDFAPPGILGEVFSAVEFEGDLVVGGSFTVAGHARVRNVARWDGRAFHPMGSFDDEVRALTIHQGRLLAAGRFRIADDQPAGGVACWDGSRWSALGTGFENRSAPLRNAVHTLVSAGSRLLAGGEFTHADGREAPSLSFWDGRQWQSLSDPLSGPRPVVWSLAEFEDEILVGGEFTVADSVANLASWDGSRWRDVVGGVPGSVHALYVRGDSLYVGGRFLLPADPALRNLARWDGRRWSALATGLFGDDATVETIAEYRGDLYAGGSFTLAEGTHANRVARWDGVRWRALSAGVIGQGAVHCLASFRNVFICAGRFRQLSGHSAYSIGQWTTAWNPLLRSNGMEDRVRAIAEYDGSIIAAGKFQRAGDGDGAEIVRWSDGRWHDLGAELNDEATELTVLGDELFVAGPFLTYSGGTSRHVVRFNGAFWSDPRGGIASLIRVLGNFEGGVIAGGEFLRAGGRPATRIARWDGAIWQGLAEGLDGSPEALLARGDTLFVGGRFQQAGRAVAPFLATWNVDRRWEAYAEPLNGPIASLLEYQGGLVAAGEFTGTADGSRDLGHIARWAGDEWQRLGSGFDGRVETVTAHAGRLIAGGQFRHADGKPAPGIAVWDGGSWNALAGGVTGGESTVYALWSSGGSLWVGGSFTQAGDTIAVHIARWEGSLPLQVWPGDCDDDGRVTAQDLLVIGRFFGDEGPAREHGSLLWEAQLVDDWNDNRIARADADGDGHVGADDVRALVENWQRSRFEDPGSANSTAQAAAELLATLPADAVGAGSEMRRVLLSYLGAGVQLDLAVRNPFAPGGEITFTLTPGLSTQLALFDVAGREIRRFDVPSPDGGTIRLIWDGRRGDGSRAPSGVYLLRLLTSDERETRRRIVLLR